MNICIVSLYKGATLIPTSGTFSAKADVVSYLNALGIWTFTETTSPYDVDIIFECCAAPLDPPEPPAGTFTGDSIGNPITGVARVAITPVVIPPCTDADVLTYSIIGTLPEGISFDTGTRTFSGTYTGDCNTTPSVIMRCSDWDGQADTTIYFSFTCQTSLYIGGSNTSIRIANPSTMAALTPITISLPVEAKGIQSDENYLYVTERYGLNIYKYHRNSGTLLATFTTLTGTDIWPTFLTWGVLYFIEIINSTQVAIKRLNPVTMTLLSGSVTQTVTNVNPGFRPSFAQDTLNIYVAVDGCLLKIVKSTFLQSGSTLTLAEIGKRRHGSMIFNTTDSCLYVWGYTTKLYKVNSTTMTLVTDLAPGTNFQAMSYVASNGTFVVELTWGVYKIQKISTSLVRTTLMTLSNAPNVEGIGMINDGTYLYVACDDWVVRKIHATTGAIAATYTVTTPYGLSIG